MCLPLSYNFTGLVVFFNQKIPFHICERVLIRSDNQVIN